ncbi:hypothetical protein [Pseudonocardia sp. DSM 45834]|uniref:OmpR/PhoB-type domain-containing protein n=1 Tax=Pseudonocardia charpentierae TaxID=3075545 RepID=A0ABU2NEQ5_9PSEU|nr:hypothetical protein [Pseudonocardia sp. DSM 45834]MDT0351928.1 hypothetical protein [Pseudonocardia sp. DSM 45834]
MEQTAPDGVDGCRPFTVHVFGHTTVSTPDRTLRASDFTGVKPRQILELVALGRGEPVRKTVIAEHIWSGRPPRRWQVTLESYVALLRRALQPGVPGRATVLGTTPGGYRFDTERVRIDLHDFEERIRRAGHTAPGQALRFWESAVSIADGTLLATEPYAAWAVDARRAHERALHAAAAAGAEIALALREAERAVPLARLATARPAGRARLAAAHPGGARRRTACRGCARLPRLPCRPPTRSRPGARRAHPRALRRRSRRSRGVT